VGTLPDAFCTGFTEAVGDDPTIDLIHPVQVDDSAGFLVIQGDTATFIRYEGSRTEALFLGDLSEGTYTERISRGGEGVEIEIEFSHERLCGRPLIARFTRPFRTPGMWTSDKTDREVARGERLRTLFKRLAGFQISPSPDAHRAR
jgi:hypothetical protein